jgi:hypothetical protein
VTISGRKDVLQNVSSEEGEKVGKYNVSNLILWSQTLRCKLRYKRLIWQQHLRKKGRK